MPKEGQGTPYEEGELDKLKEDEQKRKEQADQPKE